MAKIYGQLEKAQLENTTSDTASLPKGTATYRTDLNQMKVSNGTTMKAIIDEDSTQTMANKTLTTPVIDASAVVEEIPTPANPSAGYHKIYFKSDGKFYRLNSSGVEVEVGAGTTSTYTLEDITASGTWNVPAGVNWIILEAFGGGGGGSNGPSGATSGGAGGGGAGAIAITRAVTAGETITITIGAGGSAGTTPTDGGTTIVSSATLGTLNFYGGRAAAPTSYAYRFGGASSSGGGAGGQATYGSTILTGAGGSTLYYQGGAAGSYAGGGGAGGGGNGGAGGATGTSGAANSGAGGGGGTNLGVGGDGGSGRVRIYYYV